MAQIDDIVAALMLRPGISNISTELITDIVQDLINYVAEHINLEVGLDLPSGCVSIVKDLAVAKCNRLGSEGLSSTNNSGVSESYIEDIPKDILRKLKRYRKLPKVIQ